MKQQLNHILALFFSLTLFHHNHSLPVYRPPTSTLASPTAATISTTPPPSTTQTCRPSYIPNLMARIHESSCVRDEFDGAFSSLRSHEDFSQEQPNCNGFSGIWSTISREPWKVYYALERNVELLGRVNVSLVNTSHSDHICRLKGTILPFLYDALTSSCNCVTCDSKQEAESEVLSIALGHDDLSEYCTVWTIKETLINLLKIRLPGVSDEDLQCTLNFEEREQILDIGRQVRALDYNPESCTLPGDYPTHVCRTQSHFALFQELPALLRNETDSEGLADELETMIPYINSTLQDQLEAPCSHEPVTNMISANNCTIVKLYNSIVLTMELNTYFTCENDEAVVQRVTPPPAPLPSRPVPTSSWRNLYPNQS